MKDLKVWLIIFLVGFSIFSVFKYATLLKEKYALVNTIEQIKAHAASLEKDLSKEKQRVIQTQERNELLRENLRASGKRMSNLYHASAQAHQLCDELNTQLSIVRAENDALRKDGDILKFKVTQLAQENEDFRVKLGSIEELKKTIRELKRQAHRFIVTMKNKMQPKEYAEGNRGFILKNGKSTYPAKVRIEVIPAP